MPKELIYEDHKGSLLETENWWHLDEVEDGDPVIIHEWSYTTISTLATDSGTKELSLDEARAVAPPEVLTIIAERFGQ